MCIFVPFCHDSISFSVTFKNAWFKFCLFALSLISPSLPGIWSPSMPFCPNWLLELTDCLCHAQCPFETHSRCSFSASHVFHPLLLGEVFSFPTSSIMLFGSLLLSNSPEVSCLPSVLSHVPCHSWLCHGSSHRVHLHPHRCRHMGLMTRIYSSCPAPCSRFIPISPTAHWSCSLKAFPSPHIQQSLAELIISPTKPVPLPSSLFLPWRPCLTVIPAQNFEVISDGSLAFILGRPQPFPIMPDNHQVLLTSSPNFSYFLDSFPFS